MMKLISITGRGIIVCDKVPEEVQASDVMTILGPIRKLKQIQLQMFKEIEVYHLPPLILLHQ